MMLFTRSFGFMRSAVFVCMMISVATQAHLRAYGSKTVDREEEVPPARLLFTATEERALGERLAYCYALRHRTVNENKYRQRIMRVAARLRRTAGAPELRVVVLKSDRLKAVSFPGGRIFLTTALLEELADDDELAAVLAHEAAHSAARHTVRLISLALVLPAEARKGFPTRKQILTGAVLNFEYPQALAEASKAYEREADAITLRWLRAARYRETALSRLLERIARRLPAHGSGQHPTALRERITALDK